MISKIITDVHLFNFSILECTQAFKLKWNEDVALHRTLSSNSMKTSSKNSSKWACSSWSVRTSAIFKDEYYSTEHYISTHQWWINLLLPSGLRAGLFGFWYIFWSRIVCRQNSVQWTYNEYTNLNVWDQMAYLAKRWLVVEPWTTISVTAGSNLEIKRAIYPAKRIIVNEKTSKEVIDVNLQNQYNASSKLPSVDNPCMWRKGSPIPDFY